MQWKRKASSPIARCFDWLLMLVPPSLVGYVQAESLDRPWFEF